MSEHTVPAAPDSGDDPGSVVRAEVKQGNVARLVDGLLRDRNKALAQRDALQRQVNAVKALLADYERLTVTLHGTDLAQIARQSADRLRAALSGGDTPAEDEHPYVPDYGSGWRRATSGEWVEIGVDGPAAPDPEKGQQ